MYLFFAPFSVFVKIQEVQFEPYEQYGLGHINITRMKSAEELLVLYVIIRDGQAGPPHNVLILCTMYKEHRKLRMFYHLPISQLLNNLLHFDLILHGRLIY
jgi:hypothetical protein